MRNWALDGIDTYRRSASGPIPTYSFAVSASAAYGARMPSARSTKVLTLQDALLKNSQCTVYSVHSVHSVHSLQPAPSLPPCGLPQHAVCIQHPFRDTSSTGCVNKLSSSPLRVPSAGSLITQIWSTQGNGSARLPFGKQPK